MALCRYLHAAGANLVVSDPLDARSQAAAAEFAAVVRPPDAIPATPADVLAPCALGGVLDAATVERLQVAIVCGGANNQLATPEDAERLAARDILYVPDYLANAGGVLDYHQERHDDRPDAVLAASVFHFGELTIGEVKDELRAAGHPVRLRLPIFRARPARRRIRLRCQCRQPGRARRRPRCSTRT